MPSVLGGKSKSSTALVVVEFKVLVVIQQCNTSWTNCSATTAYKFVKVVPITVLVIHVTKNKKKKKKKKKSTETV
jgi:archaellum biogenesis protein FlaJ (TadC family)